MCFVNNVALSTVFRGCLCSCKSIEVKDMSAVKKVLEHFPDRQRRKAIYEQNSTEKEFHAKVLSNSENLEDFLQAWDAYYSSLVENLELFNSNYITKWSLFQRQHFVKTFYHIRGHFHDFLWYMGNFAPNKKSKDMILQNIIDELGDHGMSHEKLYHLFAEQLGVDLTNEMIEQETYLPFIQEFNKGYIRWLHKHDWTTRVSAFAALERLDNVDYANTKKIAENLGVQNRGLAFFNVHMNSKHFEHVLNDEFYEVWESEPEKVKYAFDFVAKYQAGAWKALSDEILKY